MNISDINVQDLQNIFKNTVSGIKNFDSSIQPNIQSNIQSNIESKIKTGIDEISNVLSDNIETSLTPAITNAITDIIKPKGGILENVQDTYEYYKFYINIIFYLIFTLFIMCIITMSANIYANYMYITTPSPVTLINKNNEKLAIYDFKYFVKEIGNLICKINNNLLEENIRSAILDIRIIPEQMNNTEQYISIFEEIINNSTSYNILKNTKFTKVIIDIFIDHIDYSKLYKYLIDNSYKKLSIIYNVGNINIKIKFKIYQKRNESYYLLNKDNYNSLYIENYKIYPLNDVKIIGSKNSTIQVLNNCFK